jgi:hypothetical protein
MMEHLLAEIEANNEKFEALWGTILSRMDIHQARTETIQEGMEARTNKDQAKIGAAIGSGQEEMRADISSIWAELEESMKHQGGKTSWCPSIMGPRELRAR